jgi:hypothetical protein
MSPIGIIHDGGMLGQGRKILMKKKMEIIVLQLKNK